MDETPLTPELLPAWREQIGYVPQDSFHFHDTVRGNLLWARPEASEAELDSENERRVQDAIDRLHGRLTILVITHRLTSVRFADWIHVLDAGRVVQSGDWDSLVNGSSSRFRAMCEAQGLTV